MARFGKPKPASFPVFPGFKQVFRTVRRLSGRPQKPGSGTLVLQLALEPLDLLGKGGVVAGQRFDLAHGVQDGGVIAAAEFCVRSPAASEG